MRTLRTVIISLCLAAGVSACEDMIVNYQSPDVSWDTSATDTDVDNDVDSDSDADSDSDSDVDSDSDSDSDGDTEAPFFDCEPVPIPGEIYPEMRCGEYDESSPIVLGAVSAENEDQYNAIVAYFSDALEDNCGYEPEQVLPGDEYLEECSTAEEYNCLSPLTIIGTCADELPQEFFGSEEACLGRLTNNSVSGDNLTECEEVYGNHCNLNEMLDCNGWPVDVKITRDELTMHLLEDAVDDAVQTLDAYFGGSDVDGGL